MTILVTGGAGFIGSHLCEELLERGEDVVALDSFDPYYDREIKEKNIEDVTEHPKFELVEEDIRNRERIEKVFDEHEVRKVVHLAARAGVRPSVTDPQLYEEVNVRGTINLLESSKEHDVENFVYGSSSSVYGETEEVPFGEDGPTNPISPYAASKLSAEEYCGTYSRLHGLNVSILRFFTVYGPRQRPEMAIHKFTRLIEKDEKIPVYGDGTSKRDYTYVDDIVSGMTAALENNFDLEVFNLGNSETIELRRLISIIEEKLGKEARMDRRPMPDGDVPITYADISKAENMLGYDPRVSIEEGIRNFVEWYRENESLLEGV